MKYIFQKLESQTATKKKQILKRLVDAYTACQMEQGRVIDAIYGALSNRDLTFKEQVLRLLDVQKDRVLHEVVNFLNPEAWSVPDDYPMAQIPHLYSSYAIAIGQKIGLRGTKAARLDVNATPVNPQNTTRLHQLYCNMFSVTEFIQSVVNDVNQQGKDADRFLDRDLLGKWAGDEKGEGWNPFFIYFDTDKNPGTYVGEPTRENEFQPFLNPQTTLLLLKQLFLTAPANETQTQSSQTN